MSHYIFLPPIECRQLRPDLVIPLIDFFKAISANSENFRFHPHPLTAEEAACRCDYKGDDLYYVLIEAEGGRVLGYGMLRGWDEGYAFPSLGIAIHPEAQGVGLGRLLMQFLHVAAKRRSAQKIRLKVYSDNQCAVNLYQQLGYYFDDEEDGQLVGWKELK